jgi:hypothetical protein
MNGDEFKKWLKKQKDLIRGICQRHEERRAGRIPYRSGEQDRNSVQTGPYNLVPSDSDERRVNVFLWVQGTNQHPICAHRRIYAFNDALIPQLELRDHYDNGRPYLRNGRPFRTTWLPDLEAQLEALDKGRYCFASIEDFERGFPW